MYRILIAKQGLPKNAYAFYKKTVTVVDQETDVETITTEIFETDDMEA